MQFFAHNVSIVIPTYCREDVLVNTVMALLRLQYPAGEIIVVDQTPVHSEAVEKQLAALQSGGEIAWYRLATPSITAAMNYGLLKASNEIVLFLDDDIFPSPHLVAAHAANYTDDSICAVVGQVLQPGDVPVDRVASHQGVGVWKDLNYIFCSSRSGYVENCMAGNLSVLRSVAIEAGAMDENFVGVAYRFETEFARRLVASSGKKIKYDPRAAIDHLQAADGGTRTEGSHLKSASPVHSSGDYYFAFLQARGLERLRYCGYRFARSVSTRFHLTHPWWIPVTLLGELRGYCQAKRLSKLPQKLITATDGRTVE